MLLLNCNDVTKVFDMGKCMAALDASFAEMAAGYAGGASDPP